MIRSNPDHKFLEIREEAVRWMEVEEKPATGWNGQKSNGAMLLVDPIVGRHASRFVLLNTLVHPTSSFNVRVANLTDEDLWIQPRTSIGILHAVSGIKTDVEFTRVSINEEVVTMRYKGDINPCLMQTFLQSNE